MNVLLVSLDERARMWMRRAMDPAWHYLEAVNGIEALKRANEDHVDLVVADESTEPYGAFGLARELKILADPPHVIVVLTRAQDTWLAKWSGADLWFVKPVDPFALSAGARELLGKETAAPATVAPETSATS